MLRAHLFSIIFIPDDKTHNFIENHKKLGWGCRNSSMDIVAQDNKQTYRELNRNT
jgi:hypothetical protein